MSKCIKCGSYAFDLYKEDIDQGGLCDVHYWQGRAHRAEALAKQPAPVQQGGLEMVDDEGENQAVRMFLALYGGACGVTAEQMRKHLTMAGFDGAWPEWVNSNNGHLTKAGSQLWIRHLFSLEQPAQQQEPVASIFISGIGEREFDDWGHDLPVGRNLLYTSPPAQRKPLTDEQLNVAWHDRWTNSSLPNTPYGCFVGGIRLAEAAHNIKEKNT